MKLQKRWMSDCERLRRRCWTCGAPASYPSTDGSGRWTLLCETSLTQFPPHSRSHATQAFARMSGLISQLGTDRPVFNPIRPLPAQPNQHPPTLMPPLGLQVPVTELGELKPSCYRYLNNGLAYSLRDVGLRDVLLNLST